MSISSRQLLSRLKSTRLLCPYRKYDNMLVERITGQIPSILPFVDPATTDVLTNKQKTTARKSIKFQTIDDWQMSFFQQNLLQNSELETFRELGCHSHHPMINSVLNDDNSLRESYKISISRSLQRIQRPSSLFAKTGHEASHTQYFKSQEESPSDDDKQKIRWLELKLRSELPKFLEPGKLPHDFNVYASNIELVIARTSECRICSGISAYKAAVYLYRLICKLWLRQPRLDILSVTCDEDKKVIDVRWRISGRPYYSLLFSFLLPPRRLNRYYDFVSVLSVNTNGRIWRHLVTKLRPVRSHLFNELTRVRKGLGDSAVMGPLASRHARCDSSDSITDS